MGNEKENTEESLVRSVTWLSLQDC